MNYKDYKTKASELESQLEKLKADYIEEYGLAIGTPVIFLGRDIGWDNESIGKLHHVIQRHLDWSGQINHNILPAKKDGKVAKKGKFIYFCGKKHLQVVTND